MSGALDKEKIYEVLRNYHTRQFPAKIKDDTINDLRIEFGVMEDQIIGMILSLANGKTEFIDSTKDLVKFHDKIERNVAKDHQNDTSRNLLTDKITQLTDLLTMAKDAGFRLRPVRGAVKIAA